MADKQPQGFGRRIKDMVLAVVDVVKENPVKVAVGCAVVLIIVAAVL